MLSYSQVTGFNEFYTTISPSDIRQKPPVGVIIPDITEVNKELKTTVWKKEWKVNGPNLAKVVWAIHKNNGLEPQLPFGAYSRHAKAFIKQFGEKEAKFLILKLEETAKPNHPFTFKFVREWSLEYQRRQNKRKS